MNICDFQSEHKKALATTVTELAELFRSQGFVEGDTMKDFGFVVKNLVYFQRRYQGQHQYLSLVGTHDTGTFLEAVFMVYTQTFNSRAKPPQAPLFGLLYRTLPELQEALDKVYELPKKKA